jgi:hypothetical protein
LDLAQSDFWSSIVVCRWLGGCPRIETYCGKADFGQIFS